VPPVQTGPTVSKRMQSSKTVAVTKQGIPGLPKPANLASNGSWKHNRRAMSHQAGGLCKHYLCRRGGLGCYRGRTSSALGDHPGRQAGQLDDRQRRECPELATASGTGKPAVAVWAYRWRTGLQSLGICEGHSATRSRSSRPRQGQPGPLIRLRTGRYVATSPDQGRMTPSRPRTRRGTDA
jgi:hypothetical protein